MAREGSSPQKRQDSLIALGRSKAAGASSALPRVVTPNAVQTFSLAFSPGVGGAILAAIDITPRKSGLLFCSFHFLINAAAPDSCALSIEYVDLLTAITGGTLLAPGLVAVPTSTTPADTSGTTVTIAPENTAVVQAEDIAEINFASVPVQAVEGHRTLIAVRAVSANGEAWAVTGTVSVAEQP